jgi:lipopolysaccharide/colanic/teichoic acid biosynthesis glycosyltransferase
MARYAPAQAGAGPAAPAGSTASAVAGPPSGTRRGPGGLLRPAVPPGADAVAVSLAAVITGAGLARGACYGLAALLALALAGEYRPRICQRASDQAGRLVLGAVLPVVALLPWTPAGQSLRLAACAAGLLITLRAIGYAGLRAAFRRGLLVQQALIIGAGQAGSQLARLLREHPELGLRPCGVLDDRPADAGLPLLGRLSEAGPVVARFAVSHVLVCSAAAGTAELTAAVRACRERGARVSVLPQLPELGIAVPRTCLDEIWGVQLLPLRPPVQAPARLAAKRLVDLAAGSALCVLTAPLMLLLAVAVRLDLRMPALFRQVRIVGRGGRATIAKLRTLRPAGDPDTSWVVTAGQCSALGNLLRASHADELPQLASVLCGDMSLVGPRPERPHFARLLARNIRGYADRERVRAGLTGWAQVHGLTGNTSIEDRVRFDNNYIEYWSIWLDLLILARTLPAALTGALNSARGGRA